MSPPLSVEVSTVPPTRLGRFEIRCRLGAGAFGVVYRAYDPVLDREVALKVPHAGRLENEKDKARFLREAKAAAKLRHPNVVPVYEAGVHGVSHYLASAFIEGQTLREAIAQGRPNFQRSANLTRDLAGALFHAHRQGVVHRDIKPANIVLDGNGDPLLMDFGLARFEEGTEKLTHDGTLLGTPAYMSPEQAMGKLDEVGPASDQYSLGVVLYELLCGGTPFSGPPALVISHVINQEPPRPRSENAAIPRDLETICLKAMAKRPDDRYSDCGELAEDLHRWESGEVIRARRVGMAERLLRWSRRNPVVATLSAAIAILLLVVAAVTTTAYLREAQSRQNTELALQGLRRAQQKESEALREAREQRKLAEDSAKESRRQQQFADAARRDAEARLVELDRQKKETERERLTAVNAGHAAQSERNKAQGAAQEADLARKQAENSLEEAKRQRARAENRDRLNRIHLYDSDMNRAMQALEEKDFDRVERILYQHVPKSGDNEDLRSFEWYYLADQCGFRGRARAREPAIALHHGSAVYRVDVAHDGSALASVGLDGVPRMWNRPSFLPQSPEPLAREALQTAYLVGFRRWEPDGCGPLGRYGWNGCLPRAYSAACAADAQALPAPVFQIFGATEAYETCVVEKVEKLTGRSVYYPFRPFRQVVVTRPGHERNYWSQADSSEPLGFSRDGMRLALTRWVQLKDARGEPMREKLWRDVNGRVTTTPPALPAQPYYAYVCRRANVEIWDLAQKVKVATYDIGWARSVFALLPASTGNALAVIEPPSNEEYGPALPQSSRPRKPRFPGSVSVMAVGKDRIKLSLFPDAVAFSLNGKSFVGFSSTEELAEIVDVETGTIRRMERLPGTAIAISPEGTILTTWYEAAAEATAKPRPLRGTMADAKARVRRELELHSNATVALQEVPSGVIRARLQGHKYAVRAAAFSPDGRTLATGSEDGAIKLWDVSVGLEKCALNGHADAVLCLTFSDDGGVLLSGGRDGTVRIWQTSMMTAPGQVPR